MGTHQEDVARAEETNFPYASTPKQRQVLSPPRAYSPSGIDGRLWPSAARPMQRSGAPLLI